jgi:DNA-binding NtrC family response regulator
MICGFEKGHEFSRASQRVRGILIYDPFDLRTIVQMAVERAVCEARGDKRKAARLLGIAPTTLLRKLKSYRTGKRTSPVRRRP